MLSGLVLVNMQINSKLKLKFKKEKILKSFSDVHKTKYFTRLTKKQIIRVLKSLIEGDKPKIEQVINFMKSENDSIFN